MIAIAPHRPASRTARALEGLAWLGLCAGLMACAVTASGAAASPSPPYAAMTSQEFLGWAQAIAQAIGVLTAAANGLAIAWHRWGKPIRQPRRNRPAGG